MSAIRPVLEVLAARPTVEGAGVHLRRAFGYAHAPRFDPFLMLDHFGSDDPARFTPGFPWHPHRGIETITYVLEGEVDHADSLGNAGRIGEGDVQWMTAGSGIVHQEMPKGSPRGRLDGFQLWANLPAASKMMDPRYREVPAGTIPEAVLPGGVRVKVISGPVEGVEGPVRDIVTGPVLLDVTVPPGGTFRLEVPAGRAAFAYCFAGGAGFSPGAVPSGEGTVVRFGDGDAVEVRAEGEGARFLFASGRPLREPVAWGGPIVMNTEAELKAAFEERRGLASDWVSSDRRLSHGCANHCRPQSPAVGGSLTPKEAGDRNRFSMTIAIAIPIPAGRGGGASTPPSIHA
jgi:hypothetical protein